MKKLSINYEQIVDCLPCQVLITNPATNESGIAIAIFDTGATRSVISKRVFEHLKLRKFEDELLTSATGQSIVPFTVIDLSLTKTFIFTRLKVLVSPLPDGVDMLIGMDIMAHGDTRITNKAVTTLDFERRGVGFKGACKNSFLILTQFLQH